LVRLGDQIKAGQVLGRLEDREIRAEVELLTADAESEVEIRVSEAKLDQASAKLARTQSLQKRDPKFVSIEAYNVDLTEKRTAELGVEEALHRHRLAQLKLRQAQARVQDREFICSHDGIVVSIAKRPGESVNLGETVYQVVNPERIKVIGELDVVNAWRVRKGQAVRVSPDIPGSDLSIQQEVFSGRIAFVDPQIDSETQTCKVVAEIPNRNGLIRSGLEARMEIYPERVANAKSPLDSHTKSELRQIAPSSSPGKP